MAQNDAATLVLDSGNYFTAPYVSATPTAMPTDLLTVADPFDAIGHTSLEEVLSLTSEGGEGTTIGTLQNKTLRTKYSPRTDNIAITLQQWDLAGLKLYYGSNSEVGANGELQIPVVGEPTICTFLAVFVDGTNHFGIYAPKAEIFRGGDVSVGSTEELASLPLNVKPLIHGTNKWAFAITPLGEDVPAG